MLAKRDFHLQTGNLGYKTGLSFTNGESWVTNGILGLLFTVLFYDVADIDDNERYNMIKGHLQTRAVENVTTTISVNAISPFQTAPTMVLGKSGQCIKECVRNKPELLIYDFEKTENDFGENGRISISDMLIE